MNVSANAKKQLAESNAEHIRNKKKVAKYYSMQHKPNELKKFEHRPNFFHHVEVHKQVFIMQWRIAKIVYFTLTAFTDYKTNNPFLLSIKNISKFSGLSEPTVVKGLKQLESIVCDPRLYPDNIVYVEPDEMDAEDIPLLVKSKYTINQNTLNKYNLWVLRGKERKEYKDLYESFHRAIVISGVWAKLSTRAKALYLAFRYWAFFHAEDYMWEEFEMMGNDFDPDIHYSVRKWEVCTRPITEIFEYAGISTNQKHMPLNQLVENGLIEGGYGDWKVYLRPKNIKYTFDNQQETNQKKIKK
jgi:hypothetical protein